MDELCSSLRTFRGCERNLENEDLCGMLEKSEECVVDELCQVLVQELKTGFDGDNLRQALRNASDIAGTAPLSRKGHFLYGILDLIQQFTEEIDNGKVNDKVVKIALEIAQSAPRSYLRCKAFELLIVMSSKVGATHTLKLGTELVERGTWPTGVHEKVRIQWSVMRRRAIDLEDYYRRERCQTLPTKIEIAPKVKSSPNSLC